MWKGAGEEMGEGVRGEEYQTGGKTGIKKKKRTNLNIDLLWS
jgi:hypothetical protein